MEFIQFLKGKNSSWKFYSGCGVIITVRVNIERMFGKMGSSFFIAIDLRVNDLNIPFIFMLKHFCECWFLRK